MMPRLRRNRATPIGPGPEHRRVTEGGDDLKWTKLTPVLRNDKPTMARVLNVARDMLGPANVIEMPFPSMGSEDYAWFAERFPSAHLRIGSKIDGLETAIHRTDYQLYEEVIPLATKLMSRAVLNLME